MSAVVVPKAKSFFFLINTSDKQGSRVNPSAPLDAADFKIIGTDGQPLSSPTINLTPNPGSIVGATLGEVPQTAPAFAEESWHSVVLDLQPGKTIDGETPGASWDWYTRTELAAVVRNQAAPGLPVFLYDLDGNPATGRGSNAGANAATIARHLGTGGFSAADAATQLVEIGNGAYKLNAAAPDTNSTDGGVWFLFSGTGLRSQPLFFPVRG